MPKFSEKCDINKSDGMNTKYHNSSHSLSNRSIPESSTLIKEANLATRQSIPLAHTNPSTLELWADVVASRYSSTGCTINSDQR